MTDTTTSATSATSDATPRAILTRYSPQGGIGIAYIIADYVPGTRGRASVYDQAKTPAENHRAAAHALALDLGLEPCHLIGGTVPNGDWAFVVVPQHHVERVVADSVVIRTSGAVG